VTCESTLKLTIQHVASNMRETRM